MEVKVEEVKERVAQVLGKKPEEIPEDADFVEDLKMDSLDLLELVMELEEKLGVEIKDEDMKVLRSIRDVVNWVRGK